MIRASYVFTLVFLLLTGCAEEAPRPTDENAWRAATQSDSTGALLGAFLARDAEGEPLEGQHFPPALLIRCDRGGVSVYVNWKTDLGQDTATVQVAFDDQPERTEQWVASQDRQAAGRWGDSLAVSLVRDLLSHDRMRTTTETASGSQSWVFPLDGLEEASAPLRDVCEL